MCFRPPSADAGEIICPHCFIVAEPNPDGTCPECGEMMRPGSDPSGAAAPPAPSAPAAPAAPEAPKPPEA